MADGTTKQRYISTSIWDDDWFWALDDQQQKLYFYLITNAETNVAGVYPITLSRIAKDTRWPVEQVEAVIETFGHAGKAHYHMGYVVLPSAPRHQKWWLRSKIKSAIEAILRSLPPDLLSYMVSVGYRYPIDTISGNGANPGYHTDTLNSDLDLDSDSEKRSKIPVGERDSEDDPPAGPLPPTGGGPGAPLSPLRDSLASHYQDQMLAVAPAETWGNVGQERRSCNLMAKRTRELRPKTPMETDAQLADAILGTYAQMIRDGPGEYWTNAPYHPSELLGRWGKVTTALARNYERAKAWEAL